MLTERQTQERRLQSYLTRKLSEAGDEIAPEIRDLVCGNSQDEIEAAINLAKTKTAQILAGIRQAQARPDDVDPAWAANVREGISDLPDVGHMSMSEYARYRQAAGIGRAASGRGILDPIL